jgi:hypothetical protein
MWTLTKKNKRKIQAMDMKFLRTNEGKTRRDRITHEIFKEDQIQNLLTELEGKQLQWFSLVETMDRTRILRMALLSDYCNINPDLNVGMNIILPQAAMTRTFLTHTSLTSENPTQYSTVNHILRQYEHIIHQSFVIRQPCNSLQGPQIPILICHIIMYNYC